MASWAARPDSARRSGSAAMQAGQIAGASRTGMELDSGGAAVGLSSKEWQKRKEQFSHRHPTILVGCHRGRYIQTHVVFFASSLPRFMDGSDAVLTISYPRSSVPGHWPRAGVDLSPGSDDAADQPGRFLYFQSRGASSQAIRQILVTTQATDPGGAHGYRDVFRSKTPTSAKPGRRRCASTACAASKPLEGRDLVPGDLCPHGTRRRNVLSTGKTFGFRDGTKEDKSLEHVSYAVFIHPRRAFRAPCRSWNCQRPIMQAGGSWLRIRAVVSDLICPAAIFCCRSAIAPEGQPPLRNDCDSASLRRQNIDLRATRDRIQPAGAVCMSLR